MALDSVNFLGGSDMNLIRTKFRRAAFRAFQTWYRDNCQRFAMPLRLVDRTDRQIRLAVEGIPASLMTFSLVCHAGRRQWLEGAAYFYHGGECVDSLGWWDAYPVRQEKAVICAECAREGRADKTFANVDALWRDHIFEALLSIINSNLATLAFIDVYQSACSSWVGLRKNGAALPSGDDSTDLVASYPIRLL